MVKIKTKQTFIAVFFLLILSTQLTAAIVAAEKQEKSVEFWDSYSGIVDQVNVNLKTNLPQHVRYEQGHLTLVDFQPRHAQKIDNETVLYTADLTVDITFNLGTELDINRDLKPTQTEISERWATFFFSTDFGRTKTFSYTNKHGVSQSRDLNRELGYTGFYRERDVEVAPMNILLPHRSLTKFNPLNYGVRSPLDFDISLTEPPSEYDFGDTVITIKNKAFLYNVTSAQITSSTRTEQPLNKNIWQSDVQTAVTLIPNKGGAAQGLFSSEISTIEPGVQAIGEVRQTLIQGERSCISKGTTLQNIESSTFRLRSPNLLPHLDEVRQKYKVKYCEMAVDTETDMLKISPAYAKTLTATTGNDKSRTIGYEIKNYVDHYTMQIKFALFSYCKVEFKETATPVILENMVIEKEDYYWDNFAQGMTSISAQEQHSAGSMIANAVEQSLGRAISKWFADYWYIVVIVVVLAIAAIAIYVKSLVPPIPKPPSLHRHWK